MYEFLKRIISGILLSGWLFSTMFYSSFLFVMSIVVILMMILIFEWPKLRPFDITIFVYPILPFILIMYLQIFGYRSLNFFLFLTTFLFDSASYFFGKLFGKHKIAPHISPGKTWEGLFGGFFTLTLACFVLLKGNFSFHVILRNFFIALAISLLAFFGDLYESKLKRNARVKDSGSILPGHGGLLDRFDSILFVVVGVFLFRNYLMQFLIYNI